MDLFITLMLFVCGYVFGRTAESRHYKSIFKREAQYNNLLTFASKMPNNDVLNNTQEAHLVYGSVVISVDYFKRFIAGLRNFFGGNLTTYETLLDRGRREAILRMKEDALHHGANMIFNVKLETASISKGKGDSIGSIEVYAYGTALNVANQTHQS
ncbi:MAG: heavy metal-binding domain-containing protein [Pseudomonadota bacterium]